MESKKFSIITPSYNQGSFLERCINSILDQENVSVQHIIIDGGSSDNTLNILKKFDSHVAKWIHEEDNGQTDAINKGWKHATSKFINWLNADDTLMPDSLDIVKEAFNKFDAHVVCGYSKLIWPDGKTILKRSSKVISNFAQVIAEGQIMQPSTFWRKEVFDKFFPLPTKLNFMMDHFLWLQYISQFSCEKIMYINDVLAEVKMHPEAKSVKQLQLFDRERELIFRDLFSSYNSNKSKAEFRGFVPSNHKIKESLSEIKFYLTYDRIFLRDEFGKKTGIRQDHLRRSFVNYPFKTIAQGLKNLVRQ